MCGLKTKSLLGIICTCILLQDLCCWFFLLRLLVCCLLTYFTLLFNFISVILVVYFTSFSYLIVFSFFFHTCLFCWKCRAYAKAGSIYFFYARHNIEKQNFQWLSFCWKTVCACAQWKSRDSLWLATALPSMITKQRQPIRFHCGRATALPSLAKLVKQLAGGRETTTAG